MNTTEQKLSLAKQAFERTAGCDSANDAICLLGEGLAHLADALIKISGELQRIKTGLATNRPK